MDQHKGNPQPTLTADARTVLNRYMVLVITDDIISACIHEKSSDDVWLMGAMKKVQADLRAHKIQPKSLHRLVTDAYMSGLNMSFNG